MNKKHFKKLNLKNLKNLKKVDHSKKVICHTFDYESLKNQTPLIDIWHQKRGCLV